ncbi:integrase arm-type DNA-binding domain-containing protein [Paraburkholderia sp. GAS448]|uniref:integrase arm-type DNA-binding domain-containing protein n=1 Tax=Paraburkholderia sp. GAS448 TaxID=3035136 RepID=UPI003D21CE17
MHLRATHSRESWTYRYKSPLDHWMGQIKLGEWPAMGLPAAITERAKQRASRDGGGDPAAASVSPDRRLSIRRRRYPDTQSRICVVTT